MTENIEQELNLIDIADEQTINVPAAKPEKDYSLTTSDSLNEPNFEQKVKYCEFLASSNIIPEQYRNKPANVFIALEYGANLGLKPYVALTNVAVVNGKPCVYGDTLKALCMKYGKITETWNADKWEWTCKCEREGYPVVESTFSLQDALLAGYVGKGANGQITLGARKSQVWVQNPKRMIQMRARGFALRDAFPDVLQGLITREEANDYIDI